VKLDLHELVHSINLTVTLSRDSLSQSRHRHDSNSEQHDHVKLTTILAAFREGRSFFDDGCGLRRRHKAIGEIHCQKILNIVPHHHKEDTMNMVDEGKADVHPMVAVPEAIRTVLYETARRLVDENPRKSITTIVSSMTTADSSLLNQVLAHDVLMKEPGYPPYRASIMDGYCIRSEETFTLGGSDGDTTTPTHHVVDKILAGDGRYTQPPTEPKLNRDNNVATTNAERCLPSAYYVTTGAMVPELFDCVVPIEDIVTMSGKEQEEGEGEEADTSATKHISILKLPGDNKNKMGKWIRPVGCDIAPGSVVLPAGHTIDPVSLGLLKQSGAGTVQLKQKVTVGVLSTGNELAVDGSWDLTTDGAVQGKIPDVNRPILYNVLQELGYCQVYDLGTCRDDDPVVMANVIRRALNTCEVIVTTGGISMGETDIVEQILVQELGGTLHFGRIHMKPGKPSTFVTIPTTSANTSSHTRFVFALPGNPVSGVVCTNLLVRPCLQLLYEGIDGSVTDIQPDFSKEEGIQGIVDNATLDPPEVVARLAHDISLDFERPEYHRVTLKFDASKKAWIATSTGVQRSSRLMSLRDSNALLVLPQGTPHKAKALAGENFPALLLGTDLIPKITVSQSHHLNQQHISQTAWRVGIVQLGASSVEKVEQRVQHALSGSKSGSVVIASTRTFTGKPEVLYNFVVKVDGQPVDFYIIVGSNREGSFTSNTAASACLRCRLSKVADAMALQVRLGAAAQFPTAALFETVVGFTEGELSSLLLFVPSDGLEGGLSNVGRLMKHALDIARDTNHKH